MEYKFGVCYCELNCYCNLNTANKIRDLEVFNTYKEACNRYMEVLNTYLEENPTIPADLWIVWIKTSNNKIEQLEQLIWKTKCKLIDIKE